jgi:hypothetical protein
MKRSAGAARGQVRLPHARRSARQIEAVTALGVLGRERFFPSGQTPVDSCIAAQAAEE